MSARLAAEIAYPDSDGKPMAENMKQYEKIVLVRENLRRLFPNDLVAADHLIYVKRGTLISQAPDVYVALGRPYRILGSYKVWEEEDVFPQVVFEVVSPNNSGAEMARKFDFYNRHGVQEYYVLDPGEPEADDIETLAIWVHEPGVGLVEVEVVDGFVSPLLGMIIDASGDEIIFRNPDGSPFLSHADLYELHEAETARADEEAERATREAARAEAEKLRAEAEKLRAEAEKLRAEAEKLRADGLAEQLAALQAKLKAAGLDAG
jgi:hypothetical protein